MCRQFFYPWRCGGLTFKFRRQKQRREKKEIILFSSIIIKINLFFFLALFDGLCKLLIYFFCFSLHIAKLIADKNVFSCLWKENKNQFLSLFKETFN